MEGEEIRCYLQIVSQHRHDFVTEVCSFGAKGPGKTANDSNSDLAYLAKGSEVSQMISNTSTS